MLFIYTGNQRESSKEERETMSYHGARDVANPSPLEAAPAVVGVLIPERQPMPELLPAGAEEQFGFDTKEMRKLLDLHNLEERDWLLGLMRQSRLFNPRQSGDGRVFVSPDYNQGMEQQREMTMKRVAYLLDRGVFKGWLTDKGPEAELRKIALLEVSGIYDHSLSIKIGVHFFLWYISSLNVIFGEFDEHHVALQCDGETR